MTSAKSGTSASGRPAAGSSSRTKAGSVASGIWPRIQEIAQRFIRWWVKNILPIWQELARIARDAFARIMGVLREHEPQLRRIFGRIGSFIRAVARVALPILRVAFVEILPRIIGVVIDAVDKITFWLGKIIGFVRDMRSRLSNAAEGIRAFFGPGGGFRRPFVAVRDWVSDRVDQMVTFFRNLPGRMASAIREKAEALKDAVFDILRKALPGWAEDALGISSPSKVFEKIGNAIVDGLIVGIKNKAGDLKDAALAAVGQLPTKLTGVGIEGTGPGSWRDLAAFANAQGWPVTSGFRPGDDGLHGQGKAIDVDAGSIQANAQVFFAFLRAFAGRINELFFDPIGWYVDQGRRVEGAIGDHMDHVHVALFGKGGIVTKPILGVVGEAGPEAVIPLGRGGAALAGAGPVTIVLQNHGVLGSRREVIAWLKDAIDDYQRANGGRAPF